MISKIRGGIISCIGLIVINILRGIVMIPNLELDNFILYSLIIQLGLLWFTISMWIVLKYDLVKLNSLDQLKRPIDWLIRNFAIVSVASILYTFLQNREFYSLILIVVIILVVNYIIVFVRFYRLDKNKLEFVGDLHNYMISLILLAIIFAIVNVFSELVWQRDYDFLFYFFSAMPNIFLLRYFIRELHDIEKKQRLYSID